MMAKTGICSIVVIATHKNVLSLHAKKIKPRVQPFSNDKAPKNDLFLTQSWWTEKFISWLQQKTLLMLMMMEILGSLIGRIDIETMKIDFTKISPTNKFEGPYFQKTRTNPVSDWRQYRYSRKHHLQTNYRP
jgi:hypothetical protein